MEDLNPLVQLYSLALCLIYSMRLVNIYFFSVQLIYHDIFPRMDKQYFLNMQ